MESRLQFLTSIPKLGREKPVDQDLILETESTSVQEITSEPATKPSIQGSMPKGWSVTDNSKELDEVSKEIDEEKKKIQQQQVVSDEINRHRSKLTELILHRKEYEQKVQQEKISLESQIKDEREKNSNSNKNISGDY